MPPPQLFLSRLCGGQRTWTSEFTLVEFLSRLCGGQLPLVQTFSPPSFLSRLCGGQQGLKIRRGILNFLSRLCGGQHVSTARYLRKYFLSRLCGGQQRLPVACPQQYRATRGLRVVLPYFFSHPTPLYFTRFRNARQKKGQNSGSVAWLERP